MKAFFRELYDFVRFFRTPRDQRLVVFYSEDASYLTFLDGVVDYLAKNSELRVCYVTSDLKDPMFAREAENIRAFYINRLLFLFTLLVDSKLLLMTMPDLHHMHIKRSIRGAHHVYLFHNIGSYFHVIREQGLIHYDTLFCVGPHHLQEARKEEELYGSPPRELVHFGYGRLDRILAEYREGKYADLERPRPRIFVAPGWGPWHERNSMLDLCGTELIRNLLDSDFEVVFRPHPMSRIKYPDTLDALYQEFREREAFSFDENVSHLEPFYTSDVMISDWSGVVYEFAFGTEKPVVFIDSPMKVNNPRTPDFGFEPIDVALREEIGIVVDMGGIDQIGSIIRDVLADRDRFRERIVRARDRCVFNVGASSEAGARYVIDFCRD